jgi:hypothetical protein
VAGSSDWLLVGWGIPCGGDGAVAIGASGSPVIVLPSALPVAQPGYAAIDGNAAYLWGAMGGALGIVRYALDGASPATAAILDPVSRQGSIGPIAVRDGRVWWASGTGIGSVATGGGQPGLVVATQVPGAQVQSFAIGAADLAWIEARVETPARDVFVTSRATPESVVSVGTVDATSDPFATIAMDPSETTVFVVTAATVWSAPSDGSAPLRAIHEGSLWGTFLEVDDYGVYFDEACGEGRFDTLRLDRATGTLSWMSAAPGYPYVPHLDGAVFGGEPGFASAYIRTDAGVYRVQ